ncbi:GDA1 [Candida oxycetoniae]|uniref:guanosine-diphosphatase n=1 Tax=Candida oxycetoniae TaxID=497107 RepID=A0AAI9WZS6_9ASCO|nr:GDA1 [Candida oxycetoniae]KAI3406205.2 GDA1 [Candida oxycetoniae]
MLNTRNLRLVIAVLAIFGIVVFFARSQNSIGSPVQRLNKPAQNSDASISSGNNETQQPQNQEQSSQSVDEEIEEEEKKNTLQGKPHSGSKPPYEKDNKSKANIAEKLDTSDNVAEKSPENVVENVSEKSPENVSQQCNQVDYVIMVDAGSTGSRIHVYEFNTCFQPPKLLSEEFRMLNPGLSSFDTDTVGAAKSLDPLLKAALEKVPKDKQKCTPIAVKATAGLRLLGEGKSKAILEQVRTHLEENYPFAVVPGDGISILDGKDEGVYAWVTANYLLGNIGHKEKFPTAAIFDLGGGSTQIVFEPDYKDPFPVEEETKYDFKFGDHDFTLYQFSHLGFGLMQGRNKINSLVIKNFQKDNDKDENISKLKKYSSKKEAQSATAEVDIVNPCISPNQIAKNVLVEISEEEFYIVNMKGSSKATGAQCRFLAEKTLNKDLSCNTKPCSFNGVHQPSLTRAFNKNSDMFVFSFFYDRTNPIGMPSSFTVEELRDLTKAVCEGDSLWSDVFMKDHITKLNEEPQWCLDLSFITAMLHTGYDIPLSRELKTAQTIDNNELGWCLGASLPLLDKANVQWKCRN